jgi:hypothetical protein
VLAVDKVGDLVRTVPGDTFANSAPKRVIEVLRLRAITALVYGFKKSTFKCSPRTSLNTSPIQKPFLADSLIDIVQTFINILHYFQYEKAIQIGQ